MDETENSGTEVSVYTCMYAFYLKFGSHYERSVRTSASMQLAVIMIAGEEDIGWEICVIYRPSKKAVSHVFHTCVVAHVFGGQ